MLQESPSLEGNVQNISRPQVLLVLCGIYKHTLTPIRTYMLTSTIHVHTQDVDCTILLTLGTCVRVTVIVLCVCVCLLPH